MLRGLIRQGRDARVSEGEKRFVFNPATDIAIRTGEHYWQAAEVVTPGDATRAMSKADLHLLVMNLARQLAGEALDALIAGEQEKAKGGGTDGDAGK